MLFLKELKNSPAVLSIIAVLVVVYVAQLVSSEVADGLSLPGHTEGLGDRPWSPLTVMFVHELLVHIALMVLMLAAFGTLLEQSARALDVIVVYLLAGVAGSLAILAAVAAFPSLEEEGTIVGARARSFRSSAPRLDARRRRSAAGEWVRTVFPRAWVFGPFPSAGGEPRVGTCPVRLFRGWA